MVSHRSLRKAKVCARTRMLLSPVIHPLAEAGFRSLRLGCVTKQLAKHLKHVEVKAIAVDRPLLVADLDAMIRQFEPRRLALQVIKLLVSPSGRVMLPMKD